MSNRPDWCPADVWEAVDTAGEAIYGRHERGFVMWPLFDGVTLREGIARAILAERKRCAQILLTKHENHPQDGVNWDGTYYDLYEEILGVPR